MAVVLFNERKRSTRRASVLRTSMGAIPFRANGGRQSNADPTEKDDASFRTIKFSAVRSDRHAPTRRKVRAEGRAGPGFHINHRSPATLDRYRQIGHEG